MIKKRFVCLHSRTKNKLGSHPAALPRHSQSLFSVCHYDFIRHWQLYFSFRASWNLFLSQLTFSSSKMKSKWREKRWCFPSDVGSEMNVCFYATGTDSVFGFCINIYSWCHSEVGTRCGDRLTFSAKLAFNLLGANSLKTLARAN